MPDHSPTCAYLVHHEPCTCHDTPETPVDRAARLALDLGRAKRRIAELEAAEGRVRAVVAEAQRITLKTCWNHLILAALDSPDEQQVREVPT